MGQLLYRERYSWNRMGYDPTNRMMLKMYILTRPPQRAETRCFPSYGRNQRKF